MRDDEWPPSFVDLTDPRWITIEQAMHYFRAHERTIRRWVRERPIAIRVGGRIWIDRSRVAQSMS